MSLQTCFVSGPLGRKENRETGGVIDFDYIYRAAISPAVAEAGLTAVRFDELEFGAIIHKSMLAAVIASDFFIADITTVNPNVMYELGVRHALRRGATVLVSSDVTRLPFDISYGRVLHYTLDGEGRLDDTEAARFRSTLATTIKQGIARSDSPVFEFFPEIQVQLPESLGARLRPYPPAVRETLSSKSSQKDSRDELREAEEVIKSEPNVDPAAVLDVLKRYRDLSDWHGVIRFADTIDPSLRESPEVMQIVALAFNRLGSADDQERAIAIMRELVAKTGGDSESFGVLGRIYKDRFARTADPQDLELAIASYRAGFEKQPTDYYPAINLIHLLATSGDEDDRRELTQLIPRVRGLVMDRIGENPADYWELAAALELAALSGDWMQAADLGRRMHGQAPASWMSNSSLRQLKALRDKTKLDTERLQLDKLIHDLWPGETSAVEQSNV